MNSKNYQVTLFCSLMKNVNKRIKQFQLYHRYTQIFLNLFGAPQFLSKNVLLLLCICSFAQIQAQSIADFENFMLSPNSFVNNSGETNGFVSEAIYLPNNYVDDPTFPYWSGWAISNTTDVTTPGFTNESSAITGTGAEASESYAVASTFGTAVFMNLEGEADWKEVGGLYVTNSVYAYLSMQEGDGFAKKFGGATGDDPDYFLLTVKKYLDGTLSTDSVDFYLADYRFEDNTQDYIVDEWTWLDLSSLGNADSLSFILSSSDVGEFGMNTPAYFCIDQVSTNYGAVGIESLKEANIAVYPNPTIDFVNLNWENVEPAELTVFALNGTAMIQQEINQGNNRIDLEQLPKGSYFLQLQTASKLYQELIVKQ